MDFLDRVEATSFLGNEFLLWLLFKSSRDNDIYQIGDANVELSFADQIHLEAKLSEAEQSRLKGGSPAYSPEAQVALQLGKRILKARLTLTKDERQWMFNVDADSFRLSAIKLPAVLSDEMSERFLERMFLIEELEEAWYGIFKIFLEQRLGKGWSEIASEMRAWVKEPEA